MIEIVLVSGVVVACIPLLILGVYWTVKAGRYGWLRANQKFFRDEFNHKEK